MLTSALLFEANHLDKNAWLPLVFFLDFRNTVVHNCHGKRINLAAKRKPDGKKKRLAVKRITSRQKNNLTAKRKKIDSEQAYVGAQAKIEAQLIALVFIARARDSNVSLLAGYGKKNHLTAKEKDSW